MQVVLNADIKNLGYKGEVVTVKPGYFRNYLLPNGMADFAGKSRLKVADSRKDKLVAKKEQILENAKETLEKLKGLSISIKMKTSDKGKLYASVTEKEVADAVEKAAKIKLEESFLKMDHFKDVGEHEALVHLGDGLEETIKVVVEAE